MPPPSCASPGICPASACRRRRCWPRTATPGFLLLEDLGDDLFARLVTGRPDLEPELYAAAVDVLMHLQAHPAPTGLPDLTAADWAEAAAFALDWYRFADHRGPDRCGRFPGT